MAFLKLVRYKNLLIIILTQLLTWFFLIQDSVWQFHPDLIMTVLATLLISAGGYMVNDLHDIETDRINKPGRNVVGTVIKTNIIWLNYIIFNLIAVVLGFYLSIPLGITALAIVLLLFVYARYFKGTVFLGNLIIALFMGFSVFVLWFVFQQGELKLILFYSLFAAFTGLIREIIKDMEDFEGDKKAGLNTLVVKHGLIFSKQVIYLVFVILLILFGMLLPYLYLNFHWVYFVYISLLSLIVGYLLWLTVFAETKSDFTRLSGWFKFVMIVGVLSMLFTSL